MLQNLRTGVISKNPTPHIHSVHAYFPAVAALPNGQLVATYVLGEAFEATNLRLHLSRSADGGQTWQEQGPLFPTPSGRLINDVTRLAVTPQGQLVANVTRIDRTEHPEDGLANPENLGFVPTELMLARSDDAGRTWTGPVPVPRLLHDCEFEMCAPITISRGGRWFWPTSVWRDWQGNLPQGFRMIALVSEDQGRTWPRYVTVMAAPDHTHIFWESKIVELPDGRLLAVAWRYNDATHQDEPNCYALSDDQGDTWSTPRSMGLSGQTLTPCVLPDGRVLCVYRRMDKKGLWANLSHMEGDRWVNDGEEPLWGHQVAESLTRSGENMAENFAVLRFGAPSITRLPDGQVFVAFWGYEDCISIIRWFKFRIA